jgi:two-component system chemotaxis sensor kinase CheA
VELLDRLMSGVSDMVLARNELARRLREAPGDVAVDGAFERLSSIIAEMRDAITRTRMQRIENLFVALPRMVRDLSAELGKQVLVDIEGGDVELDREMIEMIRDPLTHIIRNAVDHGIESPADRLKAGKREIGILSVAARQSGNQILIDIHDDGRGIDGRKLVDMAVSSGLLERSEAAQLSPREQLALIFEAGLSTAKQVTAISGRGVGRGPEFRDPALGDRRDRSGERGVCEARKARRGRGGDHPRPASSRSCPRRHPWSGERNCGSRPQPRRSPSVRW